MPNKITTDMSELGVAGWFNSMPARTNPDDRIYAQIIETGMLDVACAGLLLERSKRVAKNCSASI